MTLHRDLRQERIGDLIPDPENPRFPDDQRGTMSEDELFVHIADTFEALTIAESIARHGYFTSEPMILLGGVAARKVVLEGNRRLTALHGLARADLRERFAETHRWNLAAEEASIGLDFPVPALIADARSDADAIIGFRHIGSVLPWKPVQRARFLAYLIDDQLESFEEAADSVGEELSVVRMLYRNQGIITFAREKDLPEVASHASSRFGIFTAALNRATLRDYVGAPPVSQVTERVQPIEEDDLSNLVELASWLFGDRDEEKVISDSRQLTTLAKVVGNALALEELQRSRRLDEAFEIVAATTLSEPKRVLKQLATGVGNVRSAVDSLDCIEGEPRASELSYELDDLAETLRLAVRNGSEG
jgi:hypothetical protein